MNLELYKEFFQKESNGFKGFTKKINNYEVYYEVKSNTIGLSNKTFILSHGNSKSNYLKPIAIKLLEKFPNSQLILLDLPTDETSVKLNTNKEVNVQLQAEILKQISNDLKEDDIEIHFLGWELDETIDLRLDLIEADIDNVILLKSLPVWESVEILLDELKSNNNKIKKVV